MLEEKSNQKKDKLNPTLLTIIILLLLVMVGFSWSSDSRADAALHSVNSAVQSINQYIISNSEEHDNMGDDISDIQRSDAIQNTKIIILEKNDSIIFKKLTIGGN